MGTRGAVVVVWVLAFATVVVGPAGAVVEVSFTGGIDDDGGTVVGVETTVVVVVGATVVVVVVVVVVGVGVIRTERGVMATLLRGPVSPPTTATIQHKEFTGGVIVSFVSARPFGAVVTALRSTLITVSTGNLRDSEVNSASFVSSLNLLLRLLMHSTR